VTQREVDADRRVEVHESNVASHTGLMAWDKTPWAPPLVELAGGIAGHLLAWERHEHDGKYCLLRLSPRWRASSWHLSTFPTAESQRAPLKHHQGPVLRRHGLLPRCQLSPAARSTSIPPSSLAARSSSGAPSSPAARSTSAGWRLVIPHPNFLGQMRRPQA
jgi:hypothetical protein